MAIALAKALEKKIPRLAVSEEAVRQGISDARWPGRLEKIADRPRVVLDGAHNVESVRKMLEGLKRHFRFSDLILVFGSSSDKDVEGMIREVLMEADCLIVTQSSHPRAMSAQKISSLIENAGKEVFVETSAKSALEKARSLAGADDLIVVTGSLYLVGEMRQQLFSGD